ncbi:hypothetical protein DFH29DRAFT_1079268, partial [Suillus ampliporus]
MHATMSQQSGLSKCHGGDDDSHQLRTVVPDPQELPEIASKQRPPGACARCKSLKVRCEFRGDDDICKRCIGAGQECVIPGRTPRRTPPKRVHLLNQIREQAAQIQELMAQLEATNQRAASASGGSPYTTTMPLSPSSSVGLHSPTLDPNTPADSAPPKPEVQDWVAKAPASIEAFNGLIVSNPRKQGGPLNQNRDQIVQITTGGGTSQQPWPRPAGTMPSFGMNLRSGMPSAHQENFQNWVPSPPPTALDASPSTQLIPPILIPDLTGLITRCSPDPVAGGSYGNIYKCIYHGPEGDVDVAVKAIRLQF